MQYAGAVPASQDIENLQRLARRASMPHARPHPQALQRSARDLAYPLCWRPRRRAFRAGNAEDHERRGKRGNVSAGWSVVVRSLQHFRRRWRSQLPAHVGEADHVLTIGPGANECLGQMLLANWNVRPMINRLRPDAVDQAQRAACFRFAHVLGADSLRARDLNGLSRRPSRSLTLANRSSSIARTITMPVALSILVRLTGP